MIQLIIDVQEDNAAWYLPEDFYKLNEVQVIHFNETFNIQSCYTATPITPISPNADYRILSNQLLFAKSGWYNVFYTSKQEHCDENMDQAKRYQLAVDTFIRTVNAIYGEQDADFIEKMRKQFKVWAHVEPVITVEEPELTEEQFMAVNRLGPDLYEISIPHTANTNDECVCGIRRSACEYHK